MGCGTSEPYSGIKEKNNMTELIKLQNVCKDYEMGDSIVKAVCNINLVIKEGEFIAILGPSGSGKSTMMNMVGALDLTTRGDIFLRGKDIGFVFQTFNLIPTLTALENVMLPMLFHDYPRKERFERAEKLLERVGLSHRLSHFPNELSGGERQRVAIARALANEPKIILADEPTGNLDSKTGEEIINFFSELNKEGKTIIIVTHDNEIAKKAKRIIRIKDGQIIEDKFIKDKK